MKKAPRPVIQCDLKGNVIKKFPSLYAACRELGIKDGAAYYALNSGSPFAGKWKFRYADAVKPTAESLGLTPEPVLKQMAEKSDVARLFIEESELSSEINYTPGPESFDSDLKTITSDEHPMYATVEPEDPDRWLTPFERILKRKGE
jgi:hypothetical protein